MTRTTWGLSTRMWADCCRPAIRGGNSKKGGCGKTDNAQNGHCRTTRHHGEEQRGQGRECHLDEIASKIVGRKRISRPYFLVRLGYIKTCAATDIHSTQYL